LLDNLMGVKNMNKALAGAALGAVFQGVWVFCRELGGEVCFGSPFEAFKESWGLKSGVYSMGLGKFYGILDPSLLTGLSVLGIGVTIAQLTWLSSFLLKQLPKYYLLNCVLISLSIACQVIYVYCDLIGTTKHCPRNFIKEYLKQDFSLVLIPDLLQLIKDLNLPPEQTELLACLGLILTISQLIIITKNLIGHPITIIRGLIQVFLELSLISFLIFIILQHFSDVPQLTPFLPNFKPILDRLY